MNQFVRLSKNSRFSKILSFFFPNFTTCTTSTVQCNINKCNVDNHLFCDNNLKTPYIMWYRKHTYTWASHPRIKTFHSQCIALRSKINSCSFVQFLVWSSMTPNNITHDIISCTYFNHVQTDALNTSFLSWSINQH